MAEKQKKADLVEFLATARKRFENARSRNQHNVEQARLNLQFVYEIGDGQWKAEDRSEREEQGKPCLTSGQLRKFVASVANSERDQRLAGNVRPVDDAADVQTANIIAGLVRHIEQNSDAERVYTNAAEQAVSANVGYWRIESKERDDSFNQELRIVGIENLFSVTIDTEGMFAFIEQKITKEEFKHKYPKAKEENVNSDMENYSQWYDSDSLFIREYFYKERVKTVIVQARRVPDQSGQLPASESKIFDLGQNISDEEFESQGWIIEKKKTPEAFVIKWSMITGSQELEAGDFPGDEIPIIEVEGDWINVDGKIYKRNLTQGAHDDQRMYNFWITGLAERYALATKSPYFVTKKMVEGLGHIWKFLHKKLLPYVAFNHDKNMPGGPKRIEPPQISTGETAMLNIHRDNIMNTIGRFEASFGQASNERSKVAIDARSNRSELSTFHFPDNFRRAIVKSTRILINAIPHYMDTERVERLIGEDGKESSVVINHEIIDEQTGQTIKLNDLSVGKYDVVPDVKLMSTRRQEQLAGMTAFASGNPALGLLLAGDVARLQDWDGAKALAEKIDKNLPALLGIKPQNAETQPESQTGVGG